MISHKGVLPFDLDRNTFNCGGNLGYQTQTDQVPLCIPLDVDDSIAVRILHLGFLHQSSKAIIALGNQSQDA